MRILFSLTYYTPYISGLTLYVKRLGEALMKKGCEVTVLTMNFDKHCRSAEIVNGVKVIRADYLVKISKGFISSDWLVKSWQEVRKNDVVITNLPQFEGIIPAVFGKIFGKKVVAIYHCEVDLPYGILNTAVEWLLNLTHFITCMLSDKIITYTKDFADHSKLLSRFKSKLSFVYPPIPPPKTDKRVQKMISDKMPLEVDFVVGVAARLAAEKGIEYLLESIPAINLELRTKDSKLPHPDPLLKGEGKGVRSPFKIVIAGSLDPVGETSYKRKILDLVERYKDYVVFLGELKEEEMGSFYSLCDVLVLPSVNSTEAFGMVQVEAMMMGIPVVATNLPGVSIPIQKTGMGKIVPIKNSQALAEAIGEVLLNKKKYIKDASLVKKEFSIEKTIDFYDNLLLSLVAQRK